MFLLCILLATSSASGRQMAAQDPLLLVDSGGAIRLGLPESILDHPEVKSHLETGLTTSFVHTVTLDGRHDSPGKVMVDVYYEPWDHSYQVTTRSLQGTNTLSFPNYRAFSDWWREAHLTLLQLPQGGMPQRPAKVLVEVIPFSVAEQRMAQKWFTQSLKGDTTRQTVSGTPADNASASIFDMFLATSIKRKILLNFRWKVALQAG